MFDKIVDVIKIGDLISMKTELDLEKRTTTGIVVGTTLDHPPNSQGDEPPEYWIMVVFLDGTRSTLYHDEVEIIG